MSNYSTIFKLLKSIDIEDTTATLTGKVGVGTNTPTSKLDIVGTNDENLLKISNSSGDQTLLVDNLGNISIEADLTVEGNLTVNGTQTIINTETIQVEDPIILLNKNSPEIPASNSGIEIERGNSTNVRLIWDETTDRFKCGLAESEKTIAVLNSSVVDTGILTYNVSTNELQNAANLTYASNVLTTPDIKVSNLTANSIPYIASTKQLSNSDLYFVSNNIGIGNNNPTNKLDVTGNTAISGNLSVGTSSSIGKLTVISDSVTSAVANGIFDNTNQATIFLRRTTTDQTTTAGTYYGASIFFGDNVGTPYLASGIAGVQTGSTLTTGFIDDDQYGLAFFCHSGLSSGSVIQETMRITHDGIVGIGTTNPISSSKLHVCNTTNDCIALTQSTAISKHAIQRIHAGYDGTRLTTGNSIIQLASKSTDATLSIPDNNWYIGMHANAGANDFDPPLKIGFKGGSWSVPGDNDLFTIQTGGNVGVGNSNPVSKLQVNGTTQLNGDITTTPIYEWPRTLTSNTTTITGATYGNGTYTASASSIVNSTYDAWIAFDKGTNYWSSATDKYDFTTGAYLGTETTASYTGEWLQITLPVAIKLQTFSIQAVGLYSTSRAPKNFKIFGSNDAGTTFTAIGNEIIDDFNVGQTKSYTLSSNTEYTTFRIVMNKRDLLTTSTGAVQIAEWRLFGIPTATTVLCTVGESVAIGTSTPVAQLTVKGGSTNLDTTIVDNTGISCTGMYKELCFNSKRAWYMGCGTSATAETQKFILLSSDTGSGDKPYVHISYDCLNDKMYLSGGIYQNTSASNYFAGKVGLQTTTPSTEAILDINSTALCVKLPMLLSSTRSPFTTEGLFCYDSTLKAPVYRNDKGWIEARNILEELYYNISAGTTSTTLTNVATDYRMSIEANLTSVPSSGNLFTSNSASYLNWKYTGSNLNTRYFKYNIKVSFYIDSVNEKLSFSVYKNATFSTNTYSSGGTQVPSSFNQIHTPATSGQSAAVNINFIDQTAANDVYTLVVRIGNSGKKITINHFNVVCETYF